MSTNPKPDQKEQPDNTKPVNPKQNEKDNGNDRDNKRD